MSKSIRNCQRLGTKANTWRSLAFWYLSAVNLEVLERTVSTELIKTITHVSSVNSKIFVKPSPCRTIAIPDISERETFE